MISLVSLLVAAALVSQHSGFEAKAEIDNTKLTLDNNLQPNVIVQPKKPRRLKKFVHIWTPPAEEVKREAGERIELECVAMGSPAPSISWARNGKIIQDFEEVNEILPPTSAGLGQLTSKLIITSTAPGEDQYTCQATAGAKRETASSVVYTVPAEDDEEDLLVLQKLFLPSKPTITYYYNELFQDIGSVAVLPCRVHSLTKAQIFWQDRNERLIYGNSRMKVLPSGELLINGLRFDEDMGNFTCIAKNMFGKDSMTTFLYPNKPLLIQWKIPADIKVYIDVPNPKTRT